jgi:hypothetical protein
VNDDVDDLRAMSNYVFESPRLKNSATDHLIEFK